MNFRSIWNTIQYGWIINYKINFSEDSFIWLLGRCYRKTKKKKMDKNMDVEIGIDAAENEDNIKADVEGIEEFMLDFLSRIWFTYRKNFPVIRGINNYNSDCGWGCMLRCGQMILAQGLVCHFLGRNWRLKQSMECLKRNEIHRKIINWFDDYPSPNNPFSIHNLVCLGKYSGKDPRDLYGPTFVAHLLKEAFENSQVEEIKQLRIYVAKDRVIYLQDILQPYTKNLWKPLIILIPLHLGLNLKPHYRNKILSITNILKQDNCIGIIGGRFDSHHAQYFIGYQDDSLIYLDPHYCQKKVNLYDKSVTSYHCKYPRKMNIIKINPCCCVGFYCKTKNDFLDFKNNNDMFFNKDALFTFCDVL